MRGTKKWAQNWTRGPTLSYEASLSDGQLGVAKKTCTKLATAEYSIATSPIWQSGPRQASANKTTFYAVCRRALLRRCQHVK